MLQHAQVTRQFCDGEGIGYRGGYRFRCTDECTKGNYILGFGDGEGYGDGSGEGF